MLLPYLNFFHFCKNWSFISLETSVPLRRFNIQNGYSQSKQANKRQKFFSKLHTPYNRKISTVLCMHACCCFSRVPWDPMDCSPPGSSAHGIIQTKILEWVAMPSSFFWTQGLSPCLLSLALAGRLFTTSAPWEAPPLYYTCTLKITFMMCKVKLYFCHYCLL